MDLRLAATMNAFLTHYRRVILFAALAVTAWAASSCRTGEMVAPTAPEAQPVGVGAADGQFPVTGYHPWWLQGAWRSYDRAVYDEIYFFSVEIDSTGEISRRNGWPDRWIDMQRELVAAGIKVSPVVTLFDQRSFERLFQTPQASEPLMDSLLGLLRDSPAVGGLQIDFEVYQPVPAEVRSNFSDFIRRLREAMHGIRPGLLLSAYLLAFDEGDVFDEAEIARHTDYVVVQGYDLHGRSEDHTGPVAALQGWGNRSWTAILERFRSLGVPVSKIVMGTPFFGYEWRAESPDPGARTLGPGRTISYARVDSAYVSDGPPVALEAVRRHGVRRDLESGSPYYAYEDTTGWRQGWFEDAESLRRKFEWVVTNGLRGVAIYPPAYGTDDIDRLLRQIFRSEGN